ncbi:SpoIVB peptidase S55 domain-containing protein [Haliovirga abyssi]|uniref:Peptidase S55 domain-containing protein n=1 Tax=Haliovirga abyssi TaxID=2996794 RepID=A0AAU9DT07_9FUSO|nr:SpoIVB peptidase S55 domain-containing protein [Haliovirga abyssi]BDU50229.1 hypothetical protein HLVA_07980 [Haliovirga abyssi]
MKKNFLFFFFLIQISVFSVEIMNLDEIMPNMDGYGYTVFENKFIEKFNVKLLKIVKGKGTIPYYILAKVYGDNIYKAGGIIEGMSGAPIYVNKKLVGALSYTLNSINNDIGIITPIKYMLSLGEGNSNKDSEYVRPGTAISITPFRGDIYMDNIGTLTYVKNGEFYALGHSFQNLGDIKYFLNKAVIEYSLNAKSNPFKTGYSTETIGSVLEDKSSGIYGVLTDNIETYKFNLNINGKKCKFEMPKDKVTLNKFLSKGIELALNSKLDNIGFYTLTYKYDILKKDKKIASKENIYTFDNNFFENSGMIIGSEILNEVDNQYKFLDFDRVNININADKNIKIIYINDFTLDKEIYKLGDTAILSLKYHIYQGKDLKKNIPILIPSDFQVGSFVIEISPLNSQGNDTEQTGNNNQNSNNGLNNILKIEIKDGDSKSIFSKKIKFSYKIDLENNLTKNIVIDSFEANSNSSEEKN